MIFSSESESTSLTVTCCGPPTAAAAAVVGGGGSDGGGTVDEEPLPRRIWLSFLSKKACLDVCGYVCIEVFCEIDICCVNVKM